MSDELIPSYQKTTLNIISTNALPSDVVFKFYNRKIAENYQDYTDYMLACGQKPLELEEAIKDYFKEMYKIKDSSIDAALIPRISFEGSDIKLTFQRAQITAAAEVYADCINTVRGANGPVEGIMRIAQQPQRAERCRQERLDDYKRDIISGKKDFDIALAHEISINHFGHNGMLKMLQEASQLLVKANLSEAAFDLAQEAGYLPPDFHSGR